MGSRLEILSERLKDERSRKVLFVSHCLLNENTRYLGGAFCKGIHPEIASELADLNVGIVQLPCPEQLAWGGVSKKMIWWSLNAKGKIRSFLLRLAYPFFIWNTRRIFSRIASDTVKVIRDYVESDYEVLGIVGVDGSPTCGINTRLNIRLSMDYLTALDPDSLDREQFNKHLFTHGLEKGKGTFMDILLRKLDRVGITPKLQALDLMDELNNQPLKLSLRTLLSESHVQLKNED